MIPVVVGIIILCSVSSVLTAVADAEVVKPVHVLQAMNGEQQSHPSSPQQLSLHSCSIQHDMMHLSCTIAGAMHIISVNIAMSIETCLSMDIVISGGKVKENIDHLQILPVCPVCAGHHRHR